MNELVLDPAVIALTFSIIVGTAVLSARTGLALRVVGGLLLYDASVLLCLKVVTSSAVMPPRGPGRRGISGGVCGNKAAKPTRTWFALNGCKRCCKAGLKAGLVEIIDVDGAVVRLQDVLDGVLPED